MDQIVPMEGVRQISGRLDPEKALPAVSGASPGSDTIPLDGHSVLFSVPDRGTFLIAGIGDVLTGTVSALLNGDPKMSVPCSLVALPAGKKMAAKQKPFIAILSLQALQIAKPERVTILAQGHSHSFTLKHGPVGPGLLLERAGDISGNSGPEIADGLVEALLAGTALPANEQIAASLVRSIAQKDGFIEMLGTFDEGETYIQGWALGQTGGNSRVFVAEAGLKLAELYCASFDRKDLAGKGMGFSGILMSARPLAASALRSVYFRGRDGWKTLEVHEKRAVVSAYSLPGQIRAILPALSNSTEEGRARFVSAAQRFEGRDTVSELDVPVRVGLDFCAQIDNGGVILSGWLLDPEERVEKVHLRSSGWSSRLDDSWTRQIRPDVSSAFEDLSPFLKGVGAAHRHGFLVFVPCVQDELGESVYLEICLKSGGSAYAPVAIGRASLRSALRKLVASMDPVTAQSPNVLERQFLPLLCGTQAAAPVIQEVVDVGHLPERADVALVIGIDEAFDPLHFLLPVLALDTSLRDVPLVLSGPATVLTEQLPEIRRLFAFYGLSGRIVLACHADDKLDALEAGMQAAPAGVVVCLNADLVPKQSGWLPPLLSMFRTQQAPCVVAPTILYEDATIRWAGTWIDANPGQVALKQHYLGYPSRALLGAAPREVPAATFDCCVLPRLALEGVGGFTRRYLGTDEKGIDAALKLCRSGLNSYWVPEVEMIHPQGGASGERNWCKLVSSLDSRVFDDQWARVLPSLVESA